jgi:FkbM family methyltransferase
MDTHIVYSQNGECKIIKDYFANHEKENQYLTLLSIGENDGKTLSNVLACIERGWYATLVEPSEKAFAKLFALHENNEKVECLKYAISTECGIVEFFESGEHAKEQYGENHSLLSSLKKDETTKWVNDTFTKTKVEAIDFNTLLDLSVSVSFELISIDAEGMDFEILKQIDLFELGCYMLIVENNGQEKEKYINYCYNYGMKLFKTTPQNLIFVR